jgi:predicted nucleic acid-binding Zn finger protein
MEETDARQERGLVIANTAKITKRDRGTWIVPSQSGDRKGRYTVTITKEGKFCTCPDFKLRHKHCKHVYAVQYLLFRETTTDGTRQPSKRRLLCVLRMVRIGLHTTRRK